MSFLSPALLASPQGNQSAPFSRRTQLEVRRCCRRYGANNLVKNQASLLAEGAVLSCDLIIWESKMRLSLFACLLLFVMPLQAALVDNDSYTTDTVSGLDWLDLSETRGLGFGGALTENPDWRLPTNNEVEILFDHFLDNFDTDLWDLTSDGGYLYESEPAWYWINLFGTTYFDSSIDPGNIFSRGLYIDESGTATQLGAAIIPFANWYPIWGPETTSDYDFTAAGDSGDPERGIFLVRTSEVPIPAAAWLFGSALAGLMWLKRRRSV